MPHAIPRITDHIPEIVSFIEKIMEKGFAYAAGEEGNKSVYFDTAAFRAAGHRCVPSSLLGLSLLGDLKSIQQPLGPGLHRHTVENFQKLHAAVLQYESAALDRHQTPGCTTSRLVN